MSFLFIKYLWEIPPGTKRWTSCWHWRKKSRIIKVIRIHHLETMNVCTKCHGHPSNSCSNISVFSKVVGSQTTNTSKTIDWKAGHSCSCKTDICKADMCLPRTLQEKTTTQCVRWAHVWSACRTALLPSCHRGAACLCCCCRQTGYSGEGETQPPWSPQSDPPCWLVWCPRCLRESVAQGNNKDSWLPEAVRFVLAWTLFTCKSSTLPVLIHSFILFNGETN